jgi:Iron only hydrogenase large subunit, C-terminal domain
MKTIQFKEANCKNCYKCLRSCPVKAITFKNGQAEIIEEQCMICGRCLTECPQNAKVVKNDVEKVKKYISKNEKVYVSLAPSFIASFEQDRDWIFAVLKRLGFTYIEETAVGAALVSKMYEQLLNQKKMKNIITTACPSINYLIEKYYSELIPQMAPVVSPLIAHAKLLREIYGERIRIVFIGPCISKIEECQDLRNEGLVDAVITFEELYDWITMEGIDENTDLSKELNAMKESIAKIYPMPGGILKTLDKKSKKNYNCIAIDGVERCMEILDSIKKDKISNYFIEMNSCNGGCIGGQHMRQMPGGFLEARKSILDYTKKGLHESSREIQKEIRINLHQTFMDRTPKSEIPSEAIIQGILNSIGKFSKDDELNCGACGYASCIDKAIAVYQEKAQLHMCLPYMRERAESISDLILNTTPNAIIAFDGKLRVQEINKTALEMFKLDKKSTEEMTIWEMLPYEEFHTALKRKENIYNKKYYYEKYDITVNQSIIFVEKQNIAILFIQDISKEEIRRKELLEIRRETVDITQKVIEKQMRVAQEIASLLGETTAETKVTLTKLKKTMMSEMSGE